MENLEEQSQVQNRSLRLEHEWVQVLINLRMKYAKSFSGKRNSATSAWNNILKEMYDLGAPKTITRLRIKKKWMNLIAKYKQLKCDLNTKKQNAWPYFEQIDRAYSKKGTDTKEISDSLVEPSTSILLNDDSKQLSEKETFVRTLISLRYKHRNLFTGKKYAAQKGWMLIQNYLPSGEKYSITQISKVWHNLVQNYKSLIEKEPDHTKITWVYFQQLHSIMSQKKDDEGTTTIEFVDQYFQTVNGTNEEFPDNNCGNPFENILEEKPEVVPFITEVDKDQITSEEEEMEILDPIKNNNDLKSINEKKSKSTSTSLTDLLNYMKESDQKREEQMQQILNVMKEILSHLKQ